VDEERTDALIREHNGLYVDFSRQNVTETTLQVGAAGWRPCAWAWKAANEGGGGGAEGKTGRESFRCRQGLASAECSWEAVE
jgi:hypothetical protein